MGVSTKAAAAPAGFDFSGGALCLDFTNTVGDCRREFNERLTGYDALVDWGRQASVLTRVDANRLARAARQRPEQARAALRRAMAARGCLHRMFSAMAAGGTPSARDLSAFNRLLKETLPRLEVARHDGGLDWRWSGPPDALDRVLWPVLRSAAELLTCGPQRQRIRECDADRCTWLFLDRSHAGRRRWCDMKSCGNRAKARRHYRRKTGGVS